MAITPYVIREHHESVGHVGQEKVLLELPRHYNLAIEGKVLKDLVHRLVSTCVLCQAYKQPARDLAVKARPMPVPSSVGTMWRWTCSKCYGSVVKEYTTMVSSWL